MAVMAVAASRSLSLAYIVGGDKAWGCLSPGLWLGECPSSQHQPQFDNCARSSYLHV